MIEDNFQSITFSQEQYKNLVEREKRINRAEKNIKKMFDLLKDEKIILMSRHPHIFHKELKSLDIIKGSELQIYLNY